MRIIILVAIVLVGTLQAEWLNFNAGCLEGNAPTVRYGETTSDCISFDVETSGLLVETVEYDNQEFLRFNSSPGTVVLENTGFPELPHFTCFVVVPEGVDLDISCTRSCLETIQTLPVYPAPLDSVVSEHGMTWVEEFFRKDPAAYTSSQWYPSETVDLVGEFRLRDQRVAIVDVYPVQYLASEDSLRVWGDISVNVEFSGGTPVWNQTGLEHYDRVIGDRLIGYTPTVGPMNLTPSPGTVSRHEDLSNPPSTPPDYVIIVAPGLDGQFVDDFASYRASLNGFDVLITNLEDINAFYGIHGQDYYYTCPEFIRSYMEDLWESCFPESRPTYLLLIGDHDYPSCVSYTYCLPTFEYDWEDTQEGPKTEANDEWYVLFDEPWDECSGMPDMIVGRLPVRDTDILQEIFELIEDYESAITSPYPDNLQNRRFVTRLSGTDNDGESTSDPWFPSEDWTSSLCDWMGYSLDSYYCGDGEDTWDEDPPNPDGSRMTSADWVTTCKKLFERGSQVAFYTDHGDIHMFSAGLNWEEGGPVNFGLPDSTFNDQDVWELDPDTDHWFPFVLMLCCSAGTFNHLEYEHQALPVWPCLCRDQNDSPPYDFSPSCFAEEFILNTDCGAIGVFAGSNSSYIGCYRHYGQGILRAIFEKGITRTGDAILSSRLQSLDYFYHNGDPREGLAQFNLLGDPALDIGDRMKFRNRCDLIICPDDIAMNAYPTLTVSSSGVVGFSAIVRNAGWLSAGPFTVTLEISEGSGTPDIITSRCDGLGAGEETRIAFEWNNTWFNPPGSLNLSVSASDPGGQTPDSWIPNNSAETELEVEDFYPNNDGWPISVEESVVVPPVLCDFDGSSANGLEIVLATRNRLLAFADEAPTSPVWESDVYPFLITDAAGEVLRTTIPVAGNIIGNDDPEIVIDCKDDLLVFNNSSTVPVASLSHSGGWFFGFHSVSLGDFAEEADFGDRDEIVLIRDNELIILDIVGSSLTPIRTRQLPNIPGGAENISSWSSLQNINHDGTPEIIVRVKWNTLIDGPSSTRYFIYDYAADSYISQREWSQTAWPTIPAVGELPSGFQIAIPTDQSTSSYNPAWLVDPLNLSAEEDCESNPGLVSDHVPYCVMADWDPLVAGADRVLANTENQCFAWNSNGRAVSGYPREYSSQGFSQPPFPALGELDDSDIHEYSDVLVATAEGVIYGYSSANLVLDNLGFPYTLPAAIQGGFVVADIDRDGKVEVVFGTMDNYLHVWELGSCTSGYTPWPQCQHDAARTGVLVE